VFLTGKVFHDVRVALKDLGKLSVRIVRVEELYPFPAEEISRIAQESGAKKAVWIQEEPRNMGAWSYIAPLLRDATGIEPRYVGRIDAAPTSTGSAKHHAIEVKGFLAELVKLLSK
jgi:2-oxoglutarate dehydrogenase E1 component